MPRLFNSRVLIDQYDFTGKSNKVNLSYEVEEKDSSTLAIMGTQTTFPGLMKVGCDISGLMDVGVPNPDSGAGALTIAVTALAFVRATGSFLADGFAPGQTIVSSGFTAGGDNTTKIIATVTATTITVTDTTGLVNESGTANERIIGNFLPYSESFIDAKLGATTEFPVTLAPAASRSVGYAEGDPACFWKALLIKGDIIGGAVGDLHPFSIKLPITSGRLVSGKVLFPVAAQSGASGNGASSQLGAVSATQKLYAALHVTRVTGAPTSVAITVKGDADNTWPAGSVTRLTFTNFNTPTSQWVELVGPFTETWYRVEYVITGGTSPTFSAAVAVGIGPST
jgi:hypothetical protein